MRKRVTLTGTFFQFAIGGMIYRDFPSRWQEWRIQDDETDTPEPQP